MSVTDFDFDTPADDYGDNPPAVLAPPQGWDHAEDIEEAKRRCHDMKYAFPNNKKGEDGIISFAGELRDLGISPSLAATLLKDISAAPFHKATILELVHMHYRGCFGNAGMRSKHYPRASVWTAAPDEVWPRPILYDTRQHNAKNAEHFLRERPTKLIVSDGVFFTLEDNKIWREMSRQELHAEVRATDPALTLDTPRIMAIATEIAVSRFTKARPLEWIEAPPNPPSPLDVIPFSDGLLDISTGELLPHTGQFFSTGLPSFAYDPQAKCPLWTEKVAEWLHESYHPTLQEFMGYCLSSDTRFEVLLAMIGASRGGKGTITHVMQRLLGSTQYASRSMSDLGGEFSLENTLDKKVLFIPDAHSTEVTKRATALERIKSISGNDDISVNRKNKPLITGRIPAKIWIVANQHPKFLDESGALGAREIVLTFSNSWKGREDRNLRTKLEGELPGIANWSLAGLRRLRDNGGRFTIGLKGEAASRDLAVSQSPALRFAEYALKVTGDLNDFAATDEVYECYRYWATSIEYLSARETRSKNDFKSDIVTALMARGVVHTQRRWHDPALPRLRKGKTRRGFFGVVLTMVTPDD
jgi:P4 family phage/plasmid primase-like protien